MSKPHDDVLLQAMKMRDAIKQRERAGFSPQPHAGVTTEETSSPEKEALPMSSTDSEHPRLDRTALRQGYTLCVGNATRLVADARILKDAGRYRSACLVLSHALEELGAALQLYEAGGSGVPNWEEWWRRYVSHPRNLESPALDLPRTKKADERFSLAQDDLVYVGFDKNLGEFIPPREDDDSDLRELFEKGTAYAEAMLKALPAHAFERWEFEETVEQSPEMAPLILYARIEELVGHEPTISERDLLFAVARDLGRPPDEFADGYQKWKNAAPKARRYVDLLWHEQNL